MSDRVGIGELRQRLGRYLRRVRAGERLIVTERRHLLETEPLSRPVSDDGTRALEEERGERLD